MKLTDKDKSIYTTPKGAWEGGIAISKMLNLTPFCKTLLRFATKTTSPQKRHEKSPDESEPQA